MNIGNLNASMAGFGAGIVMFVCILLLVVAATGILAYVFSSLAFYRFMKNRNLNNAFLAWIPIVSVYTVGKVYDDINEKQGKKTNFSVILLVLTCVYCFVAIFLSSSRELAQLNNACSFGLYVAILVLELICYNLIFKTYTPDNSSYFILTVIFSIIPLVPFIPGLCLLKASKNEPVSGSRE